MKKSIGRLCRALYLLLILMPLASKAQFVYWDYHSIATDTVQSGAYADMKIDQLGNVHVSYWNRIEDKLIYAWRTAGSNSWQREYLDVQTQNGFKSSLAIDQTGNVAIAYYQAVNGQVNIRFARRTSPGNWQIESLPNIYNRGYGEYGPFATTTATERIQHSLELLFDENNNPQIVFFDGYMASNAFPTCTPGSIYGFRLHQGIRVNNQWLVRSLGRVSDQFTNCGGDTLPLGDRYGEYCDLVLRQSGKMEIFSLSRFNNQLIRHENQFSFVDTVWTKTDVDSFERFLPGWGGPPANFRQFFTFEGISATESADAKVHLAYASSIFYGENFCCTSLTNNLFYARMDAAGTYFHDFGFSTNRNHTQVFTHGGSDSVFIAYADISNQYFILQASADSGQTWVADTISEGVGISKTVATIHGDSIFVLLFDGAKEFLRLASRHVNGGAWHMESITVSQARGISMDANLHTFGGDTIMQTAYNDGYRGNLYYAKASKNSGWNWSITELENESANAKAVSITARPGASTYLAYSAGAPEDLKLAEFNGSAWTISVIDTAAMPQFTDIEVSASDTLYVLYYSGNMGCLKMATSSIGSNQWTIWPITCDTTGAGLYPSLEIGADNVPHISYYSELNRSLYYGKWDRGSMVWQLDSIDGGSFSAIGKFSKIHLDNAGQPAIAYLNEQEDEVWLAEQISGTWQYSLIDSQSVANIGRPIDFDYDQFGKLWIGYNFYSNFEKVKLMHRDGNTWREVGVSSSGKIANAFNVNVLGGDIYIIGKKNEIQNTGMAMLYTKNGVFVEAEEPKLLNDNVSISVFPNPTSANATLQITLEEAGTIDANVVNLLGEKVQPLFEGKRLVAGKHEFPLQLEGLPSGIYFLQMRANGRQHVLRIAVQR